MNDSHTLSSSSSQQQNFGGSMRSAGSEVVSFSPGATLQGSRHWRDVFWLGVFLLHLMVVGVVLGVLGLNRFRTKDRLKIERYSTRMVDAHGGLTEDYWPLYSVASGVGTGLGWIWLSLLGSQANLMLKFAVHILTTYLAVVSVLCFWHEQFFWGVAFAIGASLQFLYVMSVIDRLPFTMLVLQGAVKMVWNLPEVIRVSCAFMLVMLLWLVLWSFGASGVVAAGLSDGGSWWLLVVFCISLFWTGAVLCNTLHVVVSGMVFLVLIHGGREATSMPSKPLLKSLRYAFTTSFGSICYGSLFTAAIRTLRWEIRGLRSKIDNNECLLCCVDFLFHLVETLVRFFNKYAYVQIAVYGKSFNHSARDAWELFQSTGVEALIAYDCSGAILLMFTVLGGLITGTCAGVWTNFKYPDKLIMVSSTAMLMGMILWFICLDMHYIMLHWCWCFNHHRFIQACLQRKHWFLPFCALLASFFLSAQKKLMCSIISLNKLGIAMVVVESAVTSIYICFAEDPTLIQRWDADFFNQMSEALHQRLQHRSARAREVMTHSRFDGRLGEAMT